jgi:UDP-N-acetyl-D-mannosaminuronic acid dehydrogenase
LRIKLEIVVVGMGYVGIPVAALFADVEGVNVTGVQRRSKRSGWKIDYLNAGKSPFEGKEPDLPELIQRVVNNGSFTVTDDISVYKKADVILITVQTPVDQNHIPQYEALRQVATEIGRNIKHGCMIILESTVAPGTTEYIVKPILEENSGMQAGEDFNLVFSYERVMLGRLLYNLTKLPRVVGGLTPECTQRGLNLYKKIVEADLLPTDCLTAEVSKVTENTYRDVNIAFANEVALICESLGVDVYEVRRFVNSLPHIPSDPRKNPIRNMHIPGAGVGGHCLPKDPWLLKYGLDIYGKTSLTPHVIIESRKINDYMPKHMRNLIVEILEEQERKLKESKIAILGFAYLENSDDTRNSPSIQLYELLKNECDEIVIHDPYVKEYEGIQIANNIEEAIFDKDCIAIVTRHNEYTKLKPDTLKAHMRNYAVVDGRATLDRIEFIEAGFQFRGIGIPTKA